MSATVATAPAVGSPLSGTDPAAGIGEELVPVLRPLRILPVLRPALAGVLFLVLIAVQSPRSLWYAEAVAVRNARAPFAAFDAALRADDLATAVSELLTRPLAMFSTTPEVIRAPGYVFGLATVFLLSSAARRLGSLVVGSWRPPSVAKPASMAGAAALLAACHGFLGAAAAEVGPYALTLFATAAAVDLLLRVSVDHHLLTAVAAGVVCGIAAAMHLSAAVVVVAALGALALLPRRGLPVRRLAVVGLLAVGVAVPLLVATLDGPTARAQWLGTPGDTGSVGGAVSLLGGGAGHGGVVTQPGRALARLATLALVLLTLLAMLHLARMIRVTGRSTGTFVLAFPLLILLAPLLAAEIAGWAGTTDAAGRNLVTAVPGVVLLAIVELYRSGGPSSAWLGFAEWRNGYSAAAVAATGALLGSLLIGVGGVSTLACVGGACAREQWSVAIAKIEALHAPGDVVVVYAPEAVLPFDLAATRVNLRLKAAGSPTLPHTVWPRTLAAGLAAGGAVDAHDRGLQVAAAFRAAKAGKRVWVVLSRDTGSRATGAEDLDKALAREFHVQSVRTPGTKNLTIVHRYVWVFKGVSVQLFTRADVPPTAPLD